MKKQFTLFRMVFLLCAMILGGVSPALAEEETIASFTASGANSGNLNGWTINGSPSYSTSGGGFYQLTNSDISIVTPSIKWSDYSDITITISARKYGGPNATQGKISVSQGSTELTSYSPSGTSIAASSALKISPNDGTITISCPGASSSKGCGVQSIVIKGTKKASTSPLDFITLSGTYPTSFTEGDEFSHEGMTVTATYEDESTADVTSSASFTGYDMTVLGQNQTVTVSYSEGEVTRTAEYTIIVNALPKHSVTWSVNGTESEPESYKEGAAITFPANPADIEGKSFVGWTETAISGTTDEKPTFVTSATMGEADVTYYAVFAEIEGEPGWTETALSDIEDTDIFVFSNGSYAMSNDNGASAAPAAVAITVKDGKITSVVADNLKWNVSGNATGGYTFYPNGSTTTWMYCNTTASSSSNNNIRVGDGTRKSWIFDDNNYLVTNDNSTARYLSIYNNQDFRGYTNTNLAFVPKFYKYSEGSYSGYCTTVAADTREEAGLSFTESTATVEWYVADQYTGQNLTNPNNVSPITWTSSNEGVATVENGTVTVLALGETTIKASFDGDENYKKGEASYTLTVKDSRLEPTVTIHDTFITHTNVFEGTAAGKLTASVTYNDAAIEGATVTWSGDNDAVATINATSGSVDLVAAGTVTFTAAYAGNADYSAKTATYEMTVTYSDPNAPGTENNPYTVAEARAAIDAGTGVTEVYATGIVSEIVTPYDSQHGNITYNISDDGKTTSAQLQAYRGKSYNGDNFTSADDIQVGDVVTIYGNLTKYGSTYEFAQNNQLYFNQPRLTVADEDKTVTVNAEGQIKNHDAQTITINYRNFLETTPSANNVSVLFCDVNGTVAAESYDWIKSIEFNENGNGNFTMNCLFEANDGEARTGYVKVSVSTDDAIYYSDIITITQNAPIASHTATFSVNGTATDPVSYEEGEAITFPEVSGVNGMTFLGWTSEPIEGTTNEAPTIVTSATMGEENINYYAVFATGGITESLVKMTAGDTFSTGDKIVIVANSGENAYGLYQETISNSYVKYYMFDGSCTTVTSNDKNWWTVSAGSDGKWILGDETNGYLYSSGSNNLSVDTNNSSQWTLEDNNDNTNTFSLTQGRYLSCRSDLTGNNQYLFRLAGSTPAGIYKFDIYKIEQSGGYSDYCTTIPTTGTLTLNAACHDNEGKIYGTFYTNRPYIMPATLRGSVVSVDDGKLVVDEVYDGSNSEVVPANTALLISTADNFTGTHDYTITYATGGDDHSESNMLKGTLTADEETEGDGCLFYRLTMHNGETIGFWWGAAEGGKFKPGANKAYLAVPKANAARNGFTFDDEATGISQIENGKLKIENCYDLQGRKVSTPGKGLYIVNGKKIVIK